MTRRSFGHADPLQDRRRTGGSITAGPEDSGLLLTMRDANGDVPIGNVKTIVPDAGALEDLGGGVARVHGGYDIIDPNTGLSMPRRPGLVITPGMSGITIELIDDPTDGRTIVQIRSTNSAIPATAIGQHLVSLDGATFTPVLPVTTPDGWLIGEDGHPLVTLGA